MTKMGSPPSPSDRPASVAFDALHRGVQRWLWRQNWGALRPIQEAAIPVILGGGDDLLISAGTASGKTEAAFLPIASLLAERPDAAGFGCLCVSPLRALINDQARRLDDLFGAVQLPVHRWHGDVGQKARKLALGEPRGLLITTPESLEAFFVLRAGKLPALFSGISHVVVDELHVFIGTERGRQLQSLLHRLEYVVKRRVPRVGLSATLGDLSIAAEFLRPKGGSAVRRVEDDGDRQGLKLQLRGYLSGPVRESGPTATEGGSAAIARHLFKVMRGSHGLVFANARTKVEELADSLRGLSERDAVPNEFFPHHGSLARDLREDVEERLKTRAKPTTVVCTTTLELGIDVGDIESVSQVGPPPSVASLRQRLGRSGRIEGTDAILRVYSEERELDPRSPLRDRLRVALIQATGIVELLLEGWCEPPVDGRLHMSTLVQQLLSLVAQHGGVSARDAYRVLCREGPFAGVDPDMFAALLRDLGAREILSQAGDGVLVLGVTGERIVDHYSFYAAFATPDEYRIVHGARQLGSLPITEPLAVGTCLIFAGRRWLVLSVDEEAKVVSVSPAPGGRVPAFGGGGLSVDRRVREKMRALYETSQVPVYMDAPARRLLHEARDEYLRLGLSTSAVVVQPEGIALFPWADDRVVGTIVLWMSSAGFTVSNGGLYLVVHNANAAEIGDWMTAAVDGPIPDPLALAQHAMNKRRDKYDWLLGDDLLAATFASASLNARGAHEAIRRMAA